jgi:superfamily II DNA or RNA helicase
MMHDWSDSWLQQVAGWKAVKSGLSLVDRGQVKESQMQDDGCFGVVGGVKLLRVRVKRTSAMHVDTFCPCTENQRSGAMCEHGVAIIIAARKSRPSIESAGESQKNEIIAKKQAFDCQTFQVHFFPRWQQEWQSGRITVKITADKRQATSVDLNLYRWLESMKLIGRPLPWILPLAGEQSQAFFLAICEHPQVCLDEQLFEFTKEPPRILVETTGQDTDFVVRLKDEAGQFFGLRTSPWLFKDGRFHLLSSEKCRKFTITLFSEKYVQIAENELFEDIKLLSILAPVDATDRLALIEWKPLRPEIQFIVDGSLKSLTLKVRSYFLIDGKEQNTNTREQGSYLLKKSNVCFFADYSELSQLGNRLSALGWSSGENVPAWSMNEENSILHFLSEGRGEWQMLCNTWEESPRLQRENKNMVIVQATVDQQELGSGQVSLGIQFSSGADKFFDPGKIRQLLQSGKRLIKTSDGKNLVLPKEAWEVFEMTARECHFTQENGRFIVNKEQKSIVDNLFEYYSKSLTVNNISNSIDAHIAVDYPQINGTLRNYQWHGVLWMRDRLEKHGFAILADEMGLGKTIQTIVLLSIYATSDAPALVVLPTTLLSNWEREIQKFAPALKTIVLHGQNRDHERIDGQHVIVTSYGVLMRDRAAFMKRGYSLMVVDEASAIRNPETEMAKACCKIVAEKRLALTGTPLENGIVDLWSIFQYLRPGYLGGRSHFAEVYEKVMIAEPRNTVVRDALRLRVTPFILRRTKDQVAKDLPDKLEIDDWCDLSPEQHRLYHRVLEEGLSQISTLNEVSDSAAHAKLLTLLLRLRQICCDTALIAPGETKDWTIEQRSRKMERLFEIIDGSLISGRKMLIFSQFASQLRLIQQELNKRSMGHLLLDGSTQNRQQLVDKFQQTDGPAIFLISLKAGGYGLNLTAASTVVHFDPWWNPAAEQQASDRAHRIGQTKSVTVYRLLTRDTVEERVRALQIGKTKMAKDLFMNDDGQDRNAPSTMDILAIISTSGSPERS